ncbi:unnamed protein product [Mytilus coruscus]|uniref:Helitron helicase-like domain-containing protein n=1 Tax=Mytilus coruscus TaxID=42192 RepID=A0A6J8CRU4_MYTCO|nr:unnamed protein product [Mytilus coruscus]
MVRQYGLPTWFISLSSAETRWKPLLRSLGKIIDGVQYSDEDINTMTWQTKCRLVRSDLVTTARYFDYKIILKKNKGFLKRDPECIRINGYNDTVLQAWMANMDIQFVTNAFACLMYIVNYVRKGQRGMSNLLRRACEEAHKQNRSMNNQVTIG